MGQHMQPNPAADALGITVLEAKLDRLTALVEALTKDTRPLFYTVQQFAEAKGKSEKTVRRWIAEGRIERTDRGISRDQI